MAVLLATTAQAQAEESADGEPTQASETSPGAGNETAESADNTTAASSVSYGGRGESKPCKDDAQVATPGPSQAETVLRSKFLDFFGPTAAPKPPQDHAKKPCTSDPGPLCDLAPWLPSCNDCQTGPTDDPPAADPFNGVLLVLPWAGPGGDYFVVCSG